VVQLTGRLQGADRCRAEQSLQACSPAAGSLLQHHGSRAPSRGRPCAQVSFLSALKDLYYNPIPIRFSIEYQRVESLTASQQTTLRTLVATATNVLKKYIRVR
jgi:hypothetical protein